MRWIFTVLTYCLLSSLSMSAAVAANAPALIDFAIYHTNFLFFSGNGNGAKKWSRLMAS